MNKNKINFRHLRSFMEVSRLHSVKAAADKTFITQSALTQSILKMEQTFETTLFLRRHNGMYLTDAGELFQIRTERCLHYLATGVRAAQRGAERLVKKSTSANSDHLTHVQLKTLLALKNSTSYSSAARYLNVSQPAIYRAAKELEEQLNIRLFEKTSNGISLTKAGTRLTRFAQLAYRELDLAQAELSELNGRDIVKITIGSMPLARTTILPAAITRIAKLKPEINIEIVDGPYDDQLHRLLNGEIDIVIGALREPAPSTDVEQEPLFSSQLQVVARKGHPLVVKGKVQLDDLLNYRWVVPREGTPTRRRFDALIGQQLAHSGGLIECSSQIVIRELLLESDRLTFVSSHQFEQELREGLVGLVDVALEDTTRPIGMTTRKDWHPTTTQQLFISILRNLSKSLSSN